MKVTARAHPNIALVKYWGKRDPALNLPAVPSLSVTLDGFQTVTDVTWGASEDRVFLDGRRASAKEARRVLDLLDLVDPGRPPCEVVSANDFPTAAGLASSSSAFAALALAATRAAGKELSMREISVLARRGSGSACRSVYGGFVEWRRGDRDDGTDSHALRVTGLEHWDLRVIVALVDAGAKDVGSTEGMKRTATTSPCFGAFVAGADDLVDRARRAVLERDAPALFAAMERSTLLMHASMLTSVPPLRYWKPGTLAVLDAVDRLRADGVPCGWTTDAGPNVKILCEAVHADRIAAALRGSLRPPGGGAGGWGEERAPAVHVLGIGGDAEILG